MKQPLTNQQRIELARGNAIPGGRLSSLGARGATEMKHSRNSNLQSNGRKSWVGKSRWSKP